MNEEFDQRLEEVQESLESQVDELHRTLEMIKQFRNEGVDVDIENPEEEVRDELSEFINRLHGVEQRVLDNMKDIHKLRQGKTPFFAPGTPEQDAAMAAISGRKAKSRFYNRHVAWPLNNFEDWTDISPDQKDYWHPRDGPHTLEVEGTNAYRRSGIAGTKYYVVIDNRGFDPV